MGTLYPLLPPTSVGTTSNSASSSTSTTCSPQTLPIYLLLHNLNPDFSNHHSLTTPYSALLDPSITNFCSSPAHRHHATIHFQLRQIPNPPAFRSAAARRASRSRTQPWNSPTSPARHIPDRQASDEASPSWDDFSVPRPLTNSSTTELSG